MLITLQTSIIRDFLKSNADTYGTYLYVEFCHRFLRPFVIKDTTPVHAAEDAAFCIMFIGLWHRDIDQWATNKNWKEQEANNRGVNCITNETCDDVLIACNMLIQVIVLFREKYPNVLIDFSRLSSRFSEYVFQVRQQMKDSFIEDSKCNLYQSFNFSISMQALRSTTKTSTKVSAVSYIYSVKGMLRSLELAASGTGLPPLQYKRGVPNSPNKIDKQWSCAPEVWTLKISFKYK